MSKNIAVTVLGAGNMGTAVAQIIGKNGYKVKLWNWEGGREMIVQIKKFGENKKYLPGVKLSKNILATEDLKFAISDADAVFFVLPSRVVGSVAEKTAPFLKQKAVCVDASKGLDEKSLDLITEVLRKKMPRGRSVSVVTISGPAIANDMARGGFTAMNISGKDDAAKRLIKKITENSYLKLISTNDSIGVELSGALKNVYAIAMGICDGLNFTMNTKAALLVAACKEISWLVKKMGGKPETIYDLAGLGDLVGTGLCAESRNRRFGEFLALGKSKEEALRSVGQTVEGDLSTKILFSLSKKHKVKLPFAETIYHIVWDARPAKKEFVKFLVNYNKFYDDKR